jgi:hypothetical protein
MSVSVVNVSVNVPMDAIRDRREQLLCDVAELAGVSDSSISIEFKHVSAVSVRIEFRFSRPPTTPERLYADDFRRLLPELTADELKTLGVSKLIE